MDDLMPPALAAIRCCRIEFYQQHGLRDWGSKFGQPCTAAALLAVTVDTVPADAQPVTPAADPAPAASAP